MGLRQVLRPELKTVLSIVVPVVASTTHILFRKCKNQFLPKSYIELHFILGFILILQKITMVLPSDTITVL